MPKVKFISFIVRGGILLCPLLFPCSFESLGQNRNPVSTRESQSPTEPEYKYESYIDSASNYATRQRWDEAEKYTLEALKINPAEKSNWLLWANLGEIRSRKGDTSGAIEAFTIGLSRNPQSLKMLTGRAASLIQEKREVEALEDINRILEIDEKDEWSRIMRGYMYLDKGNIEEAEKDFVKLTEYHPDSSAGYEGMARIFVCRQDQKEALRYCDMAIERGENEELWYFKVSLLADTGKLSEASEALREAMKKYPRNGNMFLLRAYIHKLNFRNEEMEIDIKLAREYGADPHLIEIMEQKKTR